MKDRSASSDAGRTIAVTAALAAHLGLAACSVSVAASDAPSMTQAGALQNYAGLARYIDGVTTHAYWDWYNTPKNPPEKYSNDPDPAKRAMALDRQMQTLRAAMQRVKPNMRQGSYSATNLSPKPVAPGFAALTRIVDGTQTLGRLNGLPATVHGYAFQRLGNGPVVTALWALDNTRWPAPDGTFSTSAGTPYSLTVDAPSTSGTVTVFDMMGNATRVPFKNGLASLILTASPIYVVSTNAKLMKANVTAPIGYTGQ